MCVLNHTIIEVTHVVILLQNNTEMSEKNQGQEEIVQVREKG